MGSKPNLSVKQSTTIDTILNFDSDFDGNGHGDSTCKKALKWWNFFGTFCFKCKNVTMPES